MNFHDIIIYFGGPNIIEWMDIPKFVAQHRVSFKRSTLLRLLTLVRMLIPPTTKHPCTHVLVQG